MSRTIEQQIKHYCAYRERCHQEVRNKLLQLGARNESVEELMSLLITENYLNEERFARQFAGGKFRIKQWGRDKIIRHLKQKGISEYCIEKGLSEIPEETYRNTLDKLFLRKQAELKSEKNLFVKKKKLTNYLLQKGFEWPLILEKLNEQ